MISLAQNILLPTNKKNNQKMEETSVLVEMFEPFFQICEVDLFERSPNISGT